MVSDNLSNNDILKIKNNTNFITNEVIGTNYIKHELVKNDISKISETKHKANETYNQINNIKKYLDLKTRFERDKDSKSKPNNIKINPINLNNLINLINNEEQKDVLRLEIKKESKRISNKSLCYKSNFESRTNQIDNMTNKNKFYKSKSSDTTYDTTNNDKKHKNIPFKILLRRHLQSSQICNTSNSNNPITINNQSIKHFEDKSQTELILHLKQKVIQKLNILDTNITNISISNYTLTEQNSEKNT